MFFQEFGNNLEKYRETLSTSGRRKWPQGMSYPPWPVKDWAILFRDGWLISTNIKNGINSSLIRDYLYKWAIAQLVLEYVASLTLFFIST